jgi:basic membrane protein A
MISYCDLGYDMIFAPGNQYSDAVKQVAADYPNVAFAVLNGSTELPTANIMSILPNADQIGSIAGIIAGLMSKSGTIGFIGGMELDTTKSKLAHFESAAQVINPAIKAVSAYAGSFSDTAKGMELAASMINEGADVFFGDASAVDSGARQAIDQANGDTVKIIDIGQPADLLGQNPCVACSVVTDNARMIAICLEKVETGTFGNEVVFGSLENGAVSLGKFNDALIDAATQAMIVDYVKQLQDGTFGK